MNDEHLQWEIAYQKQPEEQAQQTEGLSKKPDTELGKRTTPGNRRANLHIVRGLDVNGLKYLSVPMAWREFSFHFVVKSISFEL